MSVLTRLPFVLLLCSLAAPGLTLADEDPARTWSDVAELSLVSTSGNSDSTTFGLKNSLKGTWERSSFEMKLSALRAESGETSRFAVGDPITFDLRDVSTSRTTAESYAADLRYDRKINERHSWFLGGGWYRNEFAGVRNRKSVQLGVSQLWKGGERTYFRTDEAFTFTDQEDVVPSEGRSDSFAGLRLGWELKQLVGKNGTYGNDLILDLNLDDSDDVRVDMSNWLAVNLSKRLALKVSHQLLYDNQPSSEALSLFDPADLTTPIGEVRGELDDVDTLFTASLVVTF